MPRSPRMNARVAFICTRQLVLFAAVLVAALLAFACVPVRAYAEDYSAFADAPQLAAPQVLIEDAGGNVLFSREADTSNPMASTTKVMTALVALESGVSLDTTYTVSEYAASNQGSVIGYVAGEQVTLRDLIWGMLIHSGGDAAVGVAEAVAGSEEAFVALMNQRASELGLTGTYYTSPDGLSDEGHYSTPRDLITLARYTMNYPQFKSIVGSASTTLYVNGTYVTFYNTNPLLNVYPGMQGIKTGYTYGAGRTFVGMASRGGQQIWFALMGEDSDETRYQDMVALLDWAFSKCEATTLATASTASLGYVQAGYRFGYVASAHVEADASLRSAPLSASVTGTQTALTTGDSTSFVMPGDTVGVLSWTLDGNVTCARRVVADSTILRQRIFSPFVAALFYELDAAAMK